MGEMPSRPLNVVTEIVRDAGMDITYAYDDLVFVEHSEVIIQFAEGSVFKLHIHKDISSDDQEEIIARLSDKAGERGCEFFFQGHFELKEKPETNEIDLFFYDRVKE